MSAAAGAVNARAEVVVDYGPDPNNPADNLFRAARRYLHGFLQPVVGFGDADPATQFHGDGPQLQDFRGAAGGGAAPMSNGGFADLGSAVTAGPMGDAASRIFAERLAARSSVL